MIKLRHEALITIAGTVWLIIGLFLFSLGLRLIVANAALYEMKEASTPLLRMLAPLFGGGHQAAIVLIVLGLFLGYFKGRFALKKTANRAIARIHSLPNPSPLHHLYNYKFYLLIALMMGLGMLLRVSHIPNDVRGVIDLLIGAALINGSLFYFKQARREARSN